MGQKLKRLAQNHYQFSSWLRRQVLGCSHKNTQNSTVAASQSCFRCGEGSRLSDKGTIKSIAAYAHIYWAGGLFDAEKVVKNNAKMGFPVFSVSLSTFTRRFV